MPIYLQMHALNVSDGLAKVLTALGSITKTLTLVVEKANRDLTATHSSASKVIFEAKSVAGTTAEATRALLGTFNSNLAFNVARALELKSFKTRDGQFAIRIAELSSDSSIPLDELSIKTGSLVSAQKAISLQKKSVLSIIKDHYGQHVGASDDGD
jgi:hypothetical protein